jgi:hypothetical protein
LVQKKGLRVLDFGHDWSVEEKINQVLGLDQTDVFVAVINDLQVVKQPSLNIERLSSLIDKVGESLT